MSDKEILIKYLWGGVFLTPVIMIEYFWGHHDTEEFWQDIYEVIVVPKMDVDMEVM